LVRAPKSPPERARPRLAGRSPINADRGLEERPEQHIGDHITIGAVVDGSRTPKIKDIANENPEITDPRQKNTAQSKELRRHWHEGVELMKKCFENELRKAIKENNIATRTAQNLSLMKPGHEKSTHA